ncbi:methylmalonyl-CoA mutase family protein [Hymenobacter humi]
MSDIPVAAPVSFAEFPAVTTAEWQARLARDLKGQDPATLRWPLPDGFILEPFYHREALAALGGPPAPLSHPQAPWLNVPALHVPEGEGRVEIDQAVAALANGADGIHFVLTDASAFAVHYLAEQLPLERTYIGYTVMAGPDQLLAQLVDAAPGTSLRGFLRFAPGAMPEGAEPGRLPHGPAPLHQPDGGHARFPGAGRERGVFWQPGRDGYPANCFQPQHRCGPAGRAAQRRNHPRAGSGGAACARGHHAQLFPRNGQAAGAAPAMGHAAARFWFAPELSQNLRIHAQTASWTQTTLDSHTNLLRHTTEAMSAVLGGADTVSVAPFDALYAVPNDFSARLARNLSVLLREESALGGVQDPAAGSYFVETLTDQLAREAWGLFQRMEEAGGLPKVRAEMLEEVKTVATDTFRRIASGQQVVVGTNRFQNRAEQFSFHPKKLLRSAAFDVTRATYPTEVLRLATALHFERREKKSKRAAVVLLGTNTNQVILESFLNMLQPHERPEIAASHPKGTLSLLYSSPEEATLMYATPEQFQRFARFIYQIPTEKQVFIPPTLLSSDMPTLQEAVRVFGFQEMKVQGYTTEQVLDRLQGR